MLRWILYWNYNAIHKPHSVMSFEWFNGRKWKLSLSHTQQGVSVVDHRDYTHLPTLRYMYTPSHSPHTFPTGVSTLCETPKSVRDWCAGLAVKELKRLIDVACQRGNSRVLMRCVYNIEFCCHKIERMVLQLRHEWDTIFIVWDLQKKDG